MAIILFAIVCALQVSTVLPCDCVPRNKTERICKADFVGTVLLNSRESDADNLHHVYEGEIGAVFRANFDIPPGNNKTDVITNWDSASCGIPLTVRQDTTANMFFMAAGYNENSLCISTCSALVCHWKDIGEAFQRNLSKDYVAKACACKWDDKACISVFNFEFIECTSVDLDGTMKI